MKFYYIYKALAHPENNGYVAPFSLKERLMHVKEAKQKLGTRFQWLCDTMDNDLKHAFGDRPNSEFVVNPQGKIVVARRWSNPAALREDLERLVGPVPRPTRISQLDLPQIERPKTAVKGVVPRVPLPGSMMPVKVRPLESNATYYVKLRAEIQPDYFREGTGKLYLGFFLNPLHKVHWNNRAAPVTYEITDMQGIEVADTQGKGPDVKADADADPREFLVEVSDHVSAGNGPPEFRITVRYFACDDAETFCKPVSQEYVVSLVRDADGGSRRTTGSRRSRGRRPTPVPSSDDPRSLGRPPGSRIPHRNR